MGVKVGSLVRDHGGRNVPKAVLASELAVDEGSSNLYQMLATAKIFGIIDETRSPSLTAEGRDFFYPTTENSERLATLKFFATPSVFRAMIERFDGTRVPTANLLTNIMLRDGVPKSWASRTASLFLSTAAELKLIDDAGFLRYDAALHNLQRTHGPSNVALSPTNPQTAVAGLRIGAITASGSAQSLAPPIGTVSPPAPNVWIQSIGGTTVRLELSEDELPFALWKRLRDYVEILKPSEPQGGSTNGST